MTESFEERAEARLEEASDKHLPGSMGIQPGHPGYDEAQRIGKITRAVDDRADEWRGKGKAGYDKVRAEVETELLPEEGSIGS